MCHGEILVITNARSLVDGRQSSNVKAYVLHLITFRLSVRTKTIIKAWKRNKSVIHLMSADLRLSDQY